jgi:hypothetical protein
LDDIEIMLIRNRRKPIAISARAILRAGTGNIYWSAFSPDKKVAVQDLSKKLYDNFFEPEMDTPLKTLDVPFGGSVSPVDALGLLIEYLIIAGIEQTGPVKTIRNNQSSQICARNRIADDRQFTRKPGASSGSLFLQRAWKIQ